MLFDKGYSLSKEYCTLCEKEIKPGEKLLMLTVCPSHGRQFWNRTSNFVYSYIDNAEKYHEECYLNKIKKNII